MIPKADVRDGSVLIASQGADVEGGMRVFLSHSSKDKSFVEGVADLLRPGSFDLDSTTFDAGILNSTVIVESLKRCELFCLFLSESSIKSPYVNFETLLGFEFLARGTIHRFLTICLDDSAFTAVSENVKFFNVVRRGANIESTARLIQGTLIAIAASGDKTLSRPFIGREDTLKELERQVNDTERPAIRAFFVSGNYGIGRRALIRKFYQNLYPEVGRIFPTINIHDFAGLEEFYRAILFTLRPSLSAVAVRTNLNAFAVADPMEKRRQIAALLNSLLSSREAAFLVDQGGVLTDRGELQPEISSVVSLLENRPHPPVAIISPRNISFKYRKGIPGIAFVGVGSLSNTESVRLVSTLLKKNDIPAQNDQIQDLVNLGDYHPFNYYQIIDEILSNGIALFLANSSDFIEWKHRQSSDYVNKISFDNTEKLIIGLLRLVPSLDFESLVDALQLNAEVASDAMIHLSSLHVIEHNGALFSISPPLRSAVERDAHLALDTSLRQMALKSLCYKLSIRIDEGSAEISLIDTAVLATIQSGDSESWVSAFLLPSHYVWLAKQAYDQGNYEDSIRLAKIGLEGSRRLSYAGFVAACRYICLPAARTGDVESFNNAINRLEKEVRDDWGRSNIAFLRGFNERMMGHIQMAETYFREAYKLSEGNHSAARELASICLTRGNIDEAERFAREARIPAQSNVFIIDILVAVLIRKLGRNAVNDLEVGTLLDLLDRLSQESGRSFFDTRRAELEYYHGDIRLARRLIENAIKKTPEIFEPRRIYADILLKEGDRPRAGEVVKWMREKVNARDMGERRSNYRRYLETYAHYLTEMGQFGDAKSVYADRAVFSEDEARKGVRDIEIVEGYRRHSS